MRYLLAAALALTFAAPALAAPALTAPPRDVSDDIARSLPHPYDVEAAGDRIGAAVGALVKVPIGDVVRSIDPAAPISRNATIADVAGRDDPDFQGRLQDQVSGMTMKAADMVRHIAVAAPALQRSLSDLQRSLDSALGGYGR